MTREQLQGLGEAGLRQMARRVGLRGARHLERSLLITGLAAYFARCPPDDEEDDEADDGPRDELDPGPGVGPAAFPPALNTETMARLLESQGQAAHASALRARLAHGPSTVPTPSTPSAAPAVLAAPAVHATQGARDQIELAWEGAAHAQPGLMIRLWTKDGRLTQWPLPVSTPQGRMQFDPPPDTMRLCAALGQLAPEGFVPMARSAVVTLLAPNPKKQGP